MIPRKFLKPAADVCRWLALALVGLGAMGAGTTIAAAEAVGEVTLAICASNRVDAQGQAIAVARNIAVHVGDRIETEQGGHVHIRFVDGAFVIVRPGSRLFIESYKYDAAHPQESAIRFRLEQGVARSISGKAAELARDRFRLNTPIAAIGVRGTDFVVQAEPDRVRVAINSGAIVLSPLGEGCAAEALGPCATSAARALSADMGKVMLEFQRQQAAPRLIPINGSVTPDRVNPPIQEEPRAAGSGTAGSKAAGATHTEVVAAQTAQTIVTREQAQRAQVPAVQPPVPDVPTVPVIPVVPVPPPVITPPPPATIAWGRWATTPWVGDSMSVSYAEASDGRKVTAGNVYYALWRPEPALPVLISNLGNVEFTLRDAQVHLLRGGVADLGSVDSAWLKVNFSARSFDTSVTMSHAAVGSSTLQAAGSIRDDGVFAVRSADGKVVAGAVTVNGKEAGYFFEQPVTGGTFIGLTRWYR